MARKTTMSTLAVNIQANAIANLLDGGFVDVLTGPQPEFSDDPLTTQKVLVSMRFGSPAFRQAEDGVIVANPITSGVGVRDGRPEFFRTYRPDHQTSVFDGSAGREKDNNMILPAATIAEGVTVGCSGLTHVVRKVMTGV